MLIWVNGMFGVGKTQVAHELCRRMPGSVVSDPELLGFGIQRMYPPELRQDFQLSPWWAPTVTEILGEIDIGHPGTVIVPMTLTDENLHRRILGGLRAGGHDVHHVALVADRAVLLRRLRGRLERPSGWAAQQFDARSELLSAQTFATHIDTSAKSIPQVADAVAEVAGVALAPPDSNPVRRGWRRASVQLDQLRPR